jgi:hypothetical protein
MTLVSAGRPPHTIFRSFAEPDMAEAWARVLREKGMDPVSMDGKALASFRRSGADPTQ